MSALPRPPIHSNEWLHSETPCPECLGPIMVASGDIDGVTVHFKCENVFCPIGKTVSVCRHCEKTIIEFDDGEGGTEWVSRRESEESSVSYCIVNKTVTTHEPV